MGHRASKLQPRIVEVLGDDLNALNERALAEQFQYGDGQQVHLVIETLCELWRLIASKDISLDRLKRMCFGASTENTLRRAGWRGGRQRVQDALGQLPRARSAELRGCV